MILRDALDAEHDGRTISGLSNSQCRVLELEDGQLLKIRIFHPSRLEQLTGADLVYEHHSATSETVRLVAVQYKIWDERVLYFSQSKNLDSQLVKMGTQFCERKLCDRAIGSPERYRLPHCMAFLRPTDRLQYPNSRRISSGYHLPICAVERLSTETRDGKPKLEARVIRRESLSHKSFEELFNVGILGSRWIPRAELDSLYQEMGLTEGTDRILVHAEDHFLARPGHRKGRWEGKSTFY